MEQHPIPQQISSYEFKLVGNMTLKQFGKAAGGVIVAVLINSSKLIFFIKYPLMSLFGLGGIMMAFVPFQDRPLETWLMAFIKSIYSPTMYLWKKTKNINWLDIDMTKNITEEYEGKEGLDVPTKDDSRAKEFIGSLPSIKLGYKEDDVEIVETDKKIEKDLKKTADEIDKEEIKVEGEKGREKKDKKVQKDDSVSDKAGDESKKISLDLKKADKLKATGKVVFGGVPMPMAPKMANVLLGMVIGKDEQIIEEAIVEIQDESGSPVRVFRTNSLGQFKSVNQLASGKYLIITEKDGYKFDRVQIELKGEILEPVKIQAK
ncbi:PrgI family protein [Patescibacteria group bacterium]|nr:PrgI family protein [Patescibacteria group bacterium]